MKQPHTPKTTQTKTAGQPAQTNKVGRVQRYIASLNYGGLVAGALFVYASLTPTLLPRGWVMQGLLSGILFAVGYGLGVLGSHLLRKVRVPEPAYQTKQTVVRYTQVALGVLFAVFLVLGHAWQNEVRTLVSAAPTPVSDVFGVFVVTVLVALFFMLVARSIRTLFHWVRKWIDKVLPAGVAYVLAFGLVTVFVYGVVNGIIFDYAREATNQAFSLKNGNTPEGVTQPKQAELSGSKSSLIDWDTLGYQGRVFIGQTPTTEKLNTFNDAGAVQPVRIYAGLESADSAKERAVLAAKDMERAGAFDREVIVVVTTTGTGWVNEEGVQPIEYMYNGDSAVVAMQYSYLPSWISFLVDKDKAKEAGTALYNEVYKKVAAMPAAERPTLLAFGESLGSFGSESAFPTEASFMATTNGAVWVGPPSSNTLWSYVTENRDTGSPQVLPVYEQGKTVRFAGRSGELAKPPTAWASPRATYLQHPSDPIVWWNPSLLFNKPDWYSEPAGFDVTHRLQWFPIVSFLQVSADMAFSTSVPAGHGHAYGNLPVEAWSYVAPPEGWTAEKTTTLKSFLGE
jgi:uncharacterized membrane protein